MVELKAEAEIKEPKREKRFVFYVACDAASKARFKLTYKHRDDLRANTDLGSNMMSKSQMYSAPS